MIYKNYSCPNCQDDVEVAINATNVQCPTCHANLRVEPDGEWFDGMWHHRTALVAIKDTPATP